jgi:hypothetical protein
MQYDFKRYRNYKRHKDSASLSTIFENNERELRRFYSLFLNILIEELDRREHVEYMRNELPLH